MESAFGNKSEHVPDKTCRFTILDFNATYEETAVNKNKKQKHQKINRNFPPHARQFL